MRFRHLALMLEAEKGKMGDAVRIMNSNGILFASWSDENRIDSLPAGVKRVLVIDMLDRSQEGYKLGTKLLDLFFKSTAWVKADAVVVDTDPREQRAVPLVHSTGDMENFYRKNGFVSDKMSTRMWFFKDKRLNKDTIAPR